MSGKPAKHVFDVAIVGGGMVGAALAAVLSANPLTRGLRVVLLDREPPPAPLPAHLPQVPDIRVSTVTPSSAALLRAVGAWRQLAAASAPFSNMQVWDTGGNGFVRYDAASLGADAMGWVCENRIIVAALHQRLRAAAAASAAAAVPGGGGSLGLELMLGGAGRIAGLELPPYNPVAQLEGGPLVRLDLEGGRSLHTRLLVGADGRGSLVRRWAQIRTTGRDYQQRGLVATLATAWPNQTAHQRFLPTGQLALLPLRGGYSSLVWSCPQEMAARLEALPRQELAAAVNEALTSGPHYPPQSLLGSLLGGLLGGSPGSSAFAEPPPVVDVVGETPKSFPLALQHAGRYTLPRLALIGDAAHSIHPLAGQGVYLGFSDAKVLADAIAGAVESGQDIGSAAWLAQHYEQPQRRRNGAMVAAIDGMSSMFGPQAGPVAGMRSLGLDIVNSSPVLKHTILRIAMHGL